MTAEKKVLEIGWIGCRESTICHEGDFEDDAIMDREPVQFLQAVSGIEGWVKKDKFGEFVLDALQGKDQRGRCTIEKGIAVI